VNPAARQDLVWVGEPVYRASEQEIAGTQPEDREGIGGEQDEQVPGDAEGRHDQSSANTRPVVSTSATSSGVANRSADPVKAAASPASARRGGEQILAPA
jgi:hypothetical protein